MKLLVECLFKRGKQVVVLVTCFRARRYTVVVNVKLVDP